MNIPSTGTTLIIIFRLYLAAPPQPLHIKVQGIIRAPLASGLHSLAALSCPQIAAFPQKYHCPGCPHRSQPAPYGLSGPVLPAPRLLSGSPRHEPRCSGLPECSRMTGMLLSMFKKDPSTYITVSDAFLPKKIEKSQNISNHSISFNLSRILYFCD